jgi:hypothetical protein
LIHLNKFLIHLNKFLTGDSGAPLRTTPVVKSSNRLCLRLQSKRNRQVSGRGSPFRTTPRVKYLNTRRVLGA